MNRVEMPRHAFAFCGFAQLLNVDLFRPAFFDNLFTVVEFELRHQVALGGRLQARKNREHRGDFKRVGRDMGAEIRVADDLLIDFYLFRQAQVIRYANDHNTIENRFVGMIGLELLPLGFVGVGDDNRVDVHEPMTSRRRNDLLLGGRDHAVEIFDFVFEYLDELNEAAIADIQRAIELKDARIAFRIEIQFRNIFAADEH